jgi:FHS family L-fucose permease-like MFS transporter
VQLPFAGIGFVTLAIVIVMFFLNLPEIKGEEPSKSLSAKVRTSAYQFPHLWLGSLAIFFYMGVEVGIPSFFADYSIRLGFTDFDGQMRTRLLAYYWGGLMVGRVAGIFILRRYSARQILSFCSVLAASVIVLSLSLGHINLKWVALFLFLGTGLFHSIMWPCIYNLALEDLGPHAKVGSGVIATSVIGAAILPIMMGGIQKHLGLYLAVACLFLYYGYIAYFAIRGSRVR